MPTLRDIVYENVREGDLYEKLDRNRVRCYACGHCCPIPEGQPGVCKVRYNQGGTLYVPWGYVGGVQCDPIEKKPFFHAYPGALAYSFGMLGCDLHCGYCQNWVTSQALRDPSAVSPPLEASPEALVQRCPAAGREGSGQHVQRTSDHQRMGGRGFQRSQGGRAGDRVSFPTATARRRCWNTCGPGSISTRSISRASTTATTTSWAAASARSSKPFAALHGMGIWLEIVTLLIPGFNDSDDELRGLTRFLASVSPDIPWHVTAFHKDYKMDDPDNTRPEDLLRAAEIGKQAGLRYIYAGNLPGRWVVWKTRAATTAPSRS